MRRWNPIDLCFDPTQPPMNDWQKRNAPHIFNPYQVKLINKDIFFIHSTISTYLVPYQLIVVTQRDWIHTNITRNTKYIW